MSRERLLSIVVRWSLWVCAFCVPISAHARVYNVKPGDKLFDILKKVQAGDEVVVQAGTYNTPGFLNYTFRGTKDKPIVIRAAQGARPIIKGVPNQNVMNLNGTYFTIRGFEIINGSHGLRLYKVAHIVLEDLEIHATKSVGISCNASTSDCDDVTIRRNEIYDTNGHGEGMYLGCNNAACVMRNSLIEQNYVHDLGGSQGDGIEMKSGSFGNIVRDNVIVNARYPAITMYGFKAANGRRPNIVERNLIWKTVDNGIQIVGQVIVRNNIIVNAGSYGIHSKPSQGFSPHSLQIVHNTIYNAKNACLKTNNWSGQKGQVVANNAFYCNGGVALDINGGAPAALFIKNAIMGRSNFKKGTFAGGSARADLGNPGQKVFYPPAGSKLLNAGEPKYGTSDDFDGRARSDGKPDVGAYERSGNAPVWKIVFGFKPGPANKPAPPKEIPTAEPPIEPEPIDEMPTSEPPAKELPVADVGGDAGTGSDPGLPDTSTNDVSKGNDQPTTTQDSGQPEPVIGKDSGGGTPDASGGKEDVGGSKGCGCSAQAPPMSWWCLLCCAFVAFRRKQRS